MDCVEEQEGLDSRAQQSRLSSKQFARINLITSAQSTCNKAERWENCKAVPVGVKGKLKSWNGHAVVGGTAKLADVGMVKTYSKSAHVNDLGFAWTAAGVKDISQLPMFG